MSTTDRRRRRSALAALLGSALAALLTITTAGAASGAYQSGAYGAEETGAGTLGGTDVWMRDNTSDVGVQPYTVGSMYSSPDIKVCPAPVECGSSQAPVVGVTNYIFVKLRNPGPYGSGTATGTLFMYRTSPGGGSAWPADWTFIGGAGATVPAGTTTVMVPWVGVPGPGHFCLLARWVSATDPMVPEGPVTTTNTRNNNNIVWRNVTSVPLEAGGGREIRPFTMGNALRVDTRNDIVFTQLAGKPFREVGGQVTVDLGQALFERWRRGGGAGTNVRPVGGTQVEILDPAKASLDNVVLGAGERLTFQLAFSARVASREPFLLNVAQFGPDGTGTERTDLGGVEYEITVGQERK